MYVAVKRPIACMGQPNSRPRVRDSQTAGHMYVAVCEIGTKKDRRVLLMVQDTKATFTLYVFTHSTVLIATVTKAAATRVTVAIIW